MAKVPDATAGRARTTGEGDAARVLALLSDRGDRRVLQEWLGDHDDYDLVVEPDDLATADFDLCILDARNLRDRRDTLAARKEESNVVIPFLLVVPGAGGGSAHDRFRQRHPDLWELVDSVVRAPLAPFELDDRVASLLRIREQSRELHRRQQQLRQIRDEHTGHGVVVTNTEGKIEYVNPAFEQQSGYSQEEVVGESPSVVQSGEHDEAFYQELWETIAEGEVWSGEVVNESKNGEQYVIDQVIAPAVGPDGEVERYIAVNHDITELKELQESLRDQSEQLELLNRVLRHDVRNDVSVILGWTDVLADHVDSEGEPILERIEASGEHIVELTAVARDLIDAVSTERDLELEPVSLDRILGAEVRRRREAFGDASIAGPEDPPGVTVCANEMLSSVFRNLLNNAVQHADSETPEVRVTVEVDETEDNVRVRVADRGPGVPDAVAAAVNDDDVRGLNSEDVGIGLYLVQKLVDVFGGDVRVEDNEPTGSVFVVELPTVDSA